MKDSRKMATGGIEYLSWQLIFGEDRLYGYGMELILNNLTMYRLFIMWSKYTHNKLLVRREIFQRMTPLEFVKRMFRVNYDFAYDPYTNNMFDRYSFKEYEKKWLGAVFCLPFKLGDKKLTELYESWFSFIIEAKNKNIL